MSKSTFFTGQPIISQILSLIPRHLVLKLVRKHNSDRYCKKFTSYDHLVSMLFSSFNQCGSLRELITGLQANEHRLCHMGLKHTPRRSTLAEANGRRTANFFSDVFHELHKHYYGCLPDSLKNKSIINRLFFIDSTTISLFSSIMAGAGSYGLNGKKKGGVKAHVLLSAKHQLPSFIHISEAKENDKKFMSKIDLPKGSIVAMDRGYNSYQHLINWTNNKVMWVTRLHPSSVWSIQKQLPVPNEQQLQGIKGDAIISLGNPRTIHLNPIQTVRMVHYYDKASNKEFYFISNNLSMNALTIASIYKQRWDIELFFKRIKQNFNFKDFLGDNENAIKIQLWCSFIADLLIKIVKDRVDKKRKRKWSYSNIAGLIRQHLSTYINLFAFLISPEKAMLQYVKSTPTTQLQLYQT